MVTDKPFLVLIVAVDSYPNEFYEATEKPLRCAVSDGAWIESWLTGVIASDCVDIQFLKNKEATRSNIQEVLHSKSNSVATAVMIFLLGHGRSDGRTAWFCPYDYDAKDGPRSGITLKDLILQGNGDSILVVGDFCYSGGLIDGFSSSGFPFESLHVIASSDLTELTFEDAELTRGDDASGSSLFMSAWHELFDEAATDGREFIDIERELIPLLKRRVPELAFKLKNRASQRPRSLSLSTQSTFLRAANANKRAPPDILSVLRTRWRRYAVATSSILVIVILLIYAASWHMRISSDGALAIYAGPEWLPATPFDTLQRVELPIYLEDFTDDRDVQANALSRGLDGAWFQYDTYGMRRWGNAVSDLLNQDARHYWKALVGHDLEIELDWNVIDLDPDFLEVGMSAVMLGPVPIEVRELSAISAAHALGELRLPIEYLLPDELSESPESIAKVCSADFSDTSVHWHQGTYWAAISLWVKTSKDLQIAKLVINEAQVLDLFLRAKPVERNFELQSGEAESLFGYNELLKAAAYALRDDLGTNALRDELDKLQDNGCDVIAALSSSILGISKTPDENLASLLKAYSSISTRYPSSVRTVQSYFFDEIVDSLITLEKEEVGAGLARLQDVIESAGMDVAQRMILQVAKSTELSGALTSCLQEYVTDRDRWQQNSSACHETEIFEPETALRTLISSYGFQDDAQRETMLQIMNAAGPEPSSGRSDFTQDPELWLPLAFSLSIDDLVENADAFELLSDKSGGKGGQIEMVSNEISTVADAVIGGFRHPDLNDEYFNVRFSSTAQFVGYWEGILYSDWEGAPRGRGYHAHLLAARAALRFGHGQIDTSTVLNALRESKKNHFERRTIVLMIRERLRTASEKELLRVYQGFLNARNAEIEPEIKVDLAEITLFSYAFLSR